MNIPNVFTQQSAGTAENISSFSLQTQIGWSKFFVPVTSIWLYRMVAYNLLLRWTSDLRKIFLEIFVSIRNSAMYLRIYIFESLAYHGFTWSLGFPLFTQWQFNVFLMQAAAKLALW